MDLARHPLFLEASDMMNIVLEVSEGYEIPLKKAIEIVKLALLDRKNDAINRLAAAIENQTFDAPNEVKICGDLDVGIIDGTLFTVDLISQQGGLNNDRT